MEAYAGALHGARTEIGESRTVPGTVNAVIARLYKSDPFSGSHRKPITQRTDRNLLEWFRDRYGDYRIAKMRRGHILEVIAEKKGPAAKRNVLRVLRMLLAFAVEQGLRADNPALGIKLKAVKTEGFHTWTEDELRRYEERHPIGTKGRLGLALLLWTCQRRSDAARLGPPMIEMHDGTPRLHFWQSKTGVEMLIPLAPPLADIIAATNMVGVKTFLVTDYGLPFTAAGFGNKFREWCDEAGLPQCSAHGMRKLFMKRGAELNWSEDYLASFSGHTDMDEIRTYVPAANKARMAAAGMAQMLAAHAPKGEK